MFRTNIQFKNEYEFKKWYKSTWLQIDVSIKFCYNQAKHQFKTSQEMNERVDSIISDVIAQSSYKDSLSVRDNYETAIFDAINLLGDKLKESDFELVKYKIKPMGTDFPGCVTYSGPYVPSENEVKESKIAHP